MPRRRQHEALTGTNHETLRKVYDDVSLHETPEAVERLEEDRPSPVVGCQAPAAAPGPMTRCRSN